MAQLLSALAVGSKIKFGKYQVASEASQDIIWKIVAKNHSGYPTNAITLLTEKIIDLRASDAKEPSNSNSGRQNYGNNRYSMANIDQWLNKDSAAGAWWAASHAADAAPSTSDSVAGYGTQYSAKAGFLNLFTATEKAAIQNTTIRVVKASVDGGSYEDIVRKVFLPSTTEVGLANEGTAEGALWAGFSNDASRIAYLTQQAFDNTPSTSKPSTVGSAWYWWLRTPYASSSDSVRRVRTDGALGNSSAYNGINGVRPALNLLSSISVSDTTDADGCYTIIWNTAPNPPGSLNVPAEIFGGKNNTISWTAGSDVDGNLQGYELEVSENGGAYINIYTGAALSFIDAVTYGLSTVQYRVRSYDSAGAKSSYVTSSIRNVINNTVPTISGSDGSLGTKVAPFTQNYTVTDPDAGASVTVVEKIDGTTLRTYTPTLGATNTFSVTGNTWLKLTNGAHTLTITATDNLGGVATRTYTFTKNMTSFSIQPTVPFPAESMPTRIAISVSRSIPGGADFEVLVCNNANDASPTWEDATSAVEGGLVHVFENTTKTAANWAVGIQVNVSRGTGSGACYVSGIGGNFE
jgi:hypothetical protein